MKLIMIVKHEMSNFLFQFNFIYSWMILKIVICVLVFHYFLNLQPDQIRKQESVGTTMQNIQYIQTRCTYQLKP